MLKNFITIASLLIVALGSQAQTRAIKDAKGNYTVVSRKDSTQAKETGHTITDKEGISHPVFISVNGKLFYNRKSISGNIYKSYIKS